MRRALAGEVYFDEDFEFLDGAKGKKLFVVLCDSPYVNDVVIVVKTTSQHKDAAIYGEESSSRKRGCASTAFRPNFFQPVSDATFEEDTWVLLEEFYEYDESDFQDNWDPLFVLDMTTTADILDCAAGSKFVEIAVKEELIKLASNIR